MSTTQARKPKGTPVGGQFDRTLGGGPATTLEDENPDQFADAQNTGQCHECGNDFNIDDASDGDGNYCLSCTNDGFATCSNCGSMLSPDDECYTDESSGKPICDGCSVMDEVNGTYHVVGSPRAEALTRIYDDFTHDQSDDDDDDDSYGDHRYQIGDEISSSDGAVKGKVSALTRNSAGMPTYSVQTDAYGQVPGLTERTVSSGDLNFNDVNVRRRIAAEARTFRKQAQAEPALPPGEDENWVDYDLDAGAPISAFDIQRREDGQLDVNARSVTLDFHEGLGEYLTTSQPDPGAYDGEAVENWVNNHWLAVKQSLESSYPGLEVDDSGADLDGVGTQFAFVAPADATADDLAQRAEAANHGVLGRFATDVNTGQIWTDLARRFRLS